MPDPGRGHARGAGRPRCTVGADDGGAVADDDREQHPAAVAVDAP